MSELLAAAAGLIWRRRGVVLVIAVSLVLPGELLSGARLARRPGSRTRRAVCP